MKNFIQIVVAVFIIIPVTISAKMPDLLFGDYEGNFIAPPPGYLKRKPECVAQVYPESKNEYVIQLLPVFNARAEKYAKTLGRLVNNRILFNDSIAKGDITNGHLTGQLLYNGKWVNFALKKIDRSSPTEGVKPPGGAVVLFDGANFDHWIGDAHFPVKWNIVNGDEMEVVPTIPHTKPKTSLFTQKTFSDLFLHLEFQLPLIAESRGQDRVNSGIRFENMFELQILDSYGLEGNYNECGALYHITPPKVNMCAPPYAWQTYDIIYYSPKFNTDGNKISDAVITVYHNGKCIHYQYPVKNRGAQEMTDGKLDFPSRIELQDHWNVLKFRNIWAIDLTKNPKVPEYVNELER